MATIPVYRFGEGRVEQREAEFPGLGKRPHRRVLREAIVMYGANRRSGTHSTKTRAEVSFTNKKPWAQKHTGNARAGTRRSPLWRKGGIIHGPRPRDHGWGMPRKALRAAVRSALLGKILDGEVAAIDGLALEAPSTKKVAAALKALSIEGKALVVTPAHDPVLFRSARNLRGASVRAAADVNAHDLLAHRKVVFVNGALDALVRAAGAADGGAPEGKE
jgi:large subunit ribosomal protein L4